MAIARDSDSAGAVVIFENDPRQAIAYQELFTGAAFDAQTALPNQDVQQLCERLKPQVVVFDMATLPHQVRRAKRFGADYVWIRGVDDAAGLPQLAGDLLEQRREGKLKPRVPSTPL